jgi:hypothetical protein
VSKDSIDVSAPRWRDSEKVQKARLALEVAITEWMAMACLPEPDVEDFREEQNNVSEKSDALCEAVSESAVPPHEPVAWAIYYFGRFNYLSMKKPVHLAAGSEARPLFLRAECAVPTAGTMPTNATISKVAEEMRRANSAPDADWDVLATIAASVFFGAGCFGSGVPTAERTAVSRPISPTPTPWEAFGRWMLEQTRSENLGNDVDGGSVQDKFIELGILVGREVTEPCDPETCQCAEYGLPTTCYTVSPLFLGPTGDTP